MDTQILIPGQNTGFIPVEPNMTTDFMAGGESAILDTVRLASGDWRDFASPGEWQRDMRSGFESDSCVSFGANDALETHGNYEIAQGNWDAADVQWLRDNGYMNSDGTLNFSDRFTAKMSGTTRNGNSLPAVWASISKNGLVPESAWPFPLDQLTPFGNTDVNWNIYFADVPANVIALGQEFLKRFAVQYEWVIWSGAGMSQTALQNALKISPLQIATAVCQPWNTSQLIDACGGGAAHCTMLANEEVGVCHDILDHYVPFWKKFAPDYTISFAMRGILVPIAQAPVIPEVFHYTFSINISYGAAATAKDVKQLQTALQTLKRPNGQTYLKAGVYGPYGPLTRSALLLFQQDHGIKDDGTHFGPQTRAAMNTALAAL